MTDARTIETHGEWLVWHDPLPIGWRGADWRYCRKDARDEFDIGVGESREMCLQSIDFVETDEAERASPEGQAKEQRIAERSADRLQQVLILYRLGHAVTEAAAILEAGGPQLHDAHTVAGIKAAAEAFAEYSA